MHKIYCRLESSKLSGNKVLCQRPELMVGINFIQHAHSSLTVRLGALFELLDLESDIDQRQNIKDCLLFLVQTTSDEQLNFWLSLCKDILASSTTTNSDSTLRSTLVVQQDQKTTGNDSPKPDQKESNLNALDDDDDDALQSAYLGESRVRDRVSPRWPTRVFAFTIVRKLMSLCDTERAHLDPVLAKEIQASVLRKID